MPQTSANGADLFYEVVGDGRPVVLLHGGACDPSFWDPQVEHLRDRHLVVLPELRGHGRSSSPAGEYSIRVLADDVAAICRHAGVSRAVIVGHSLGGLVAFAVGARHGDLAAAVAAFDAPLVVAPATEAAFQALRRTRDEDVIDLAISSTAAAFGPDFDPALRDKILEGYRGMAPHALGSICRHCYANDLAEEIRACSMPALYVGSVMPTDLTMLRELCPHIDIDAVAGAGHYVPLEAADQVNAILDRFVATAVPA